MNKGTDNLPIWISIEGIIGAGKSTYIDAVIPHLRAKYGADQVIYVPEPVDEWLLSGHLEASITEPYMAQTFFFHTRIKRFRSLYDKNVTLIITERSPMSDRLFWNVVSRNDTVSLLAKQTYPLLWNMWVEMLPLKPSLFVYLKPSSVDVAQQRMRERNRQCEQDTVTREYQTELEIMHELTFGQYTIDVDGEEVRCISVSSDLNYRDDGQIAKELADRLIEKIEVLRE